MAIFKMTHMNSTGGIDPSAHLKNALYYILNPKKCDYSRLASAKNCVADATLAYNLMMQTKKTFGKLHGRQGYHYVLSFLEDGRELPPETALEITEKFVDRYLQGRYEVVYAVHTDTDHIHSHIVFNSVAIDDGYKYHAPKGEWENAIMPIVNELCEEYGLSQIKFEKAEIEDENPEEELSESEKLYEHSSIGRNSIPYEPRRGKAPKNPKYGRKGSGYGSSTACTAAMIRRDIDECIEASNTMEEFYRMLEERGYRLRIKGNRSPGLQHETMERIRRFSSLGEGYSLEEIEAAITHGETPVPEPGISKDRLPADFDTIDESSDESPIPSQIHREMRFRFFVSGEAYSRAAFFPHARNSIEEFEALREVYDFVRIHDINSTDDLNSLHAETREKWKSARNELRRLYREIANEPTAEIMSYVEQYRALSDAVTLYKKGDDTFFEAYMEAEGLKDKLQGYGVTLNEAEEEFDKLQKKISQLKREQGKASTTLSQISKLKSLLQLDTPSEIAERLEQNIVEKQRSQSEERKRERRH